MELVLHSCHLTAAQFCLLLQINHALCYKQDYSTFARLMKLALKLFVTMRNDVCGNTTGGSINERAFFLCKRQISNNTNTSNFKFEVW